MNKKIKYSGKVYGKVEITEPVIIELINSSSLQRLKKIDQAGYIEPYFPGSRTTRFEHSIGVYILLRKFKVSIGEQILGLIHDVSHSAFSHTIDYVLDEGDEAKHNYQDNIFKNYVLNSGIPKILEKYNINTRYIINEKNFSLQEKELPDICADRIDYSLRSLISYKESTKKEVKNILENLTTINKRWVFKNFSTAEKYSKLFLLLNKKYYSGIQSGVMFLTVGNYIKYALEKNYIKKDDLYTNDEYVMQKINKNLKNDKNLNKLWKRMNDGHNFENNEKQYDYHVFCKSRIVDPIVMQNNKLQKVSDINPKWKKIVEDESKPKEYFIKFTK